MLDDRALVSGSQMPRVGLSIAAYVGASPMRFRHFIAGRVVWNTSWRGKIETAEECPGPHDRFSFESGRGSAHRRETLTIANLRNQQMSKNLSSVAFSLVCFLGGRTITIDDARSWPSERGATQSMRPSQDQPRRPMAAVFLGEHADDASLDPRPVHHVFDLGLARVEMPLSSRL